MSDEFENALRKAGARKAEAEAAARAADATQKAEDDVAKALEEEASRRAAPLLPLALEAAEELPRVGRRHVRRGEGGALKVRRGSPSLPMNLGLWGVDRPWHLGRREGWAVHTKHHRSDDPVIILVPLTGSPRVRVPRYSQLISLQVLVKWGHREWNFQPGEGLPTREVIDAETSLRQFIDVIADYVVIAEPTPRQCS